MSLIIKVPSRTMLKFMIAVQHEHSLKWRDLDKLVKIMFVDYGIYVNMDNQGVWQSYEILNEQIFSQVLLKFNIDMEMDLQKITDRLDNKNPQGRLNND